MNGLGVGEGAPSIAVAPVVARDGVLAVRVELRGTPVEVNSLGG